MLERVLPACAAVVATTGDRVDATLFPAEERALGDAVEKRRREFVTARACARSALGQLGLQPCEIPSGRRGEPCWPPGVVGSITHCDGYRACAVARAADLATIGVDAEPNEPLPPGLLCDIALPAERTMLRRLAHEDSTVAWDRLLFSAKEAVYKAWYPLAERWLGFEDALIAINRRAGAYSARLLVSGPSVGSRELTGFDGRWVVGDGVLATAIALAAAPSGSGRPA